MTCPQCGAVAPNYSDNCPSCKQRQSLAEALAENARRQQEEAQSRADSSASSSQKLQNQSSSANASMPDVELGALGVGCLTSCGAGCASLITMVILLALAGVEFTRIRPDSIPIALSFIGFLMGLGVNALVGFFTARRAEQAKMFHAILIGVILMVVGLLSLVLPLRNGNLQPLALLSWLLALPMTIWGAHWAINSE